MGSGGGVIDETTLEREQIKDLIPHRDPFLLIERVNELVPGKSGVGVFDPEGGPWYDWIKAGHFPDDPITPGCLIAESIGQTALAVLYSDGYKDYPIPRLARDNLTYHVEAIPGFSNIYLHVTIEKVNRIRDNMFASISGKAKARDDTVFCSGKIILFLIRK